MPKPLPKVTLEYNLADERYYVATIRGNKPTVDYSTGGQSRTARVGAWLSEVEVGLLSLSANLTIKRYTVWSEPGWSTSQSGPRGGGARV